MIAASAARSSQGTRHVNTLAIPQVKIRFQVCPGTKSGTGIRGATFEIRQGGVVMRRGTTPANGEVEVPIPLIQAGGCSIFIFDTEYPLDLITTLAAPATLQGQQERYDHLGYIRGHLLDPTIEPPTDGTDTSRSRVAVNQFTWDENKKVDGIAANAQPHLVAKIGV